MRTARESGESERGTAAVEFALVLPIVLVITLASVQVGLLVRDRLLVEAAVRSGARTAAVDPDDAAVRAAVLRASPALDEEAVSVTITRLGARGEPVTVGVTYSATMKVPFLAWLFPSGVSMRAEASDRQEFP